MIVKVKYCGGCNASYDRTALVRLIQDAFPSVELVWAYEAQNKPGDALQDSNHDFALAVCGCPVKCADYKDFQGSLGRFVIASQNDLSLACQKIEEAEEVAKAAKAAKKLM